MHDFNCRSLFLVSSEKEWVVVKNTFVQERVPALDSLGNEQRNRQGHLIMKNIMVPKQKETVVYKIRSVQGIHIVEEAEAKRLCRRHGTTIEALQADQSKSHGLPHPLSNPF